MIIFGEKSIFVLNYQETIIERSILKLFEAGKNIERKEFQTKVNAESLVRTNGQNPTQFIITDIWMEWN